MTATNQSGFDFAPRARNEDWMKPVSTADTRRAAQPSAKRKEALYARIMEWAAGREFTADELSAEWHCSINHVAPRLTELLQLGRLKMTGTRRKTRCGGQAAVLKERA